MISKWFKQTARSVIGPTRAQEDGALSVLIQDFGLHRIGISYHEEELQEYQRKINAIRKWLETLSDPGEVQAYEKWLAHYERDIEESREDIARRARSNRNYEAISKPPR